MSVVYSVSSRNAVCNQGYLHLFNYTQSKKCASARELHLRLPNSYFKIGRDFLTSFTPSADANILTRRISATVVGECSLSWQAERGQVLQPNSRLEWALPSVLAQRCQLFHLDSITSFT
jgi:hypothetical protein